MSFLAPLFLIGALGVAAPIIFHLIRRTSREKIPFSSIMFLRPTPPRMTRSSRLEHILLLILRCLALCVLALGFARPFIQKPVAADSLSGEGERIVLLVDASASIKRDNLWPDALARAKEVLGRTKTEDNVAVLLFDRTTRALVTFDQWNNTPIGERQDQALARLADIQPSWASTHLGNGLLTAADLLEDDAGRSETAAKNRMPRRIVVISDLQEGSRLDGLQGFQWPADLEVVIESVKAKRPTNAGLHLVLDQSGIQKTGDETDVKVRVVNSADAEHEQFQLRWLRPGTTAPAGPALDVYVPPGQSRVVSTLGAVDGVPAELLQLSGDEGDFDNTVHIVPDNAQQVRVLYLGRDTDQDSAQALYYLKRVFQKTRHRNVQLVALSPDAAVSDNDLSISPLLIAAEPLAEPALESVRSFLSRGKLVLFVMKDVSASQTIAKLAGLGTLSAEEADSERYALLGRVDFEHPLFAPFADPRFSDFAKIHFWKYRKLNPDQIPKVQILARFDQGDPALLQIPTGSGSLFVLTSSWRPADSQLALSSKFVPLLYSLLNLSGGMKDQPAQYVVGDSVSMNSTNTAQTFSVRKPDGTEVEVPGGTRFSGTDLPGIYTVSTSSSQVRFAVNVDPMESRTSPLPVEELERLQLPVHVANPGQAVRQERKSVELRAAELEQRQKLWRWLIVVALLVLILESWAAGRISRRGQVQPAGA